MIPKTATADKAAAEIAMFCLLDLFSSSLTFLIRLLRSTLELELELRFSVSKLGSLTPILPSLIKLLKHNLKKLRTNLLPEMGLNRIIECSKWVVKV